MRRAEQEISIEGRMLKLSNLGKVLYPKAGFTKAQVIDYYLRIAPVLLPHLEGRALTLKRYPNGVEGGFFYEKKCPPYRPTWLKTAPIWSETNKADIHYCLANDRPSLVWAANLADIELHTSLAKASKPERPTMLAFDLDPGLPADIVTCSRVGIWIRDLLAKMGLDSYPKTSGSKGLQVYVPLNVPRMTYEKTKGFARGVAELLEREHPDVVVSKMAKALRKGKVFVDWSQNDFHKTTVCVYSLRAKDRPTCSTPVTWSEVEKCVRSASAKALSFESHEVLARVEKRGDLFEPVLTQKQNLPPLH